LVKHFFASDQAGIYAAVSLVGRLVNMCAWSVVNTMFPVSAAARSSDREARPVLFMSLGLVFLILAVLILGLWALPSFLWRHLFGAHFELGNYGGLAALLILYAITTGIYSLSSVMITYEMSRKIANTGWFQLLISGVVISGIFTRAWAGDLGTSVADGDFNGDGGATSSAPGNYSGGRRSHLLQAFHCPGVERTRSHRGVPAKRVSSPGIRGVPP
jgi:hypothetical protein